jgi:hypothetical protein
METTLLTRWGKDHWSLLAYIETLCVDGKDGEGMIDHRRVRCNINTHPLLYQASVVPPEKGKPYEYPTRLKGYSEDKSKFLREHDDWDCFDDLEKNGLVELIGTLMNPLVKMTKIGLAYSAELREHKASGGSFSNFHPLPF